MKFELFNIPFVGFFFPYSVAIQWHGFHTTESLPRVPPQEADAGVPFTPSRARY